MKRVALTPEEKHEILDSILKSLSERLEKSVNEFLNKEIAPKLREIVREEVGKYAVTEKEAITMFSTWLQRDAQKIVRNWFFPRWFFRLFFRR